MIEICDAIETLRPGAGYVLTGTDIAGITWITENVLPLTQKEIDAEIVRLKRQAVIDERARQLTIKASIAHARSLGFTDEMIAVMYPNLVTGAEPLVVGRESLNIPAKIDNNVTLDTVKP